MPPKWCHFVPVFQNKPKRFWPFEPCQMWVIQRCFLLKHQPLLKPLGGWKVSLVLRHTHLEFIWFWLSKLFGFDMLRNYVRGCLNINSQPLPHMWPLQSHGGEIPIQSQVMRMKKGVSPSSGYMPETFKLTFCISISYLERVQKLGFKLWNHVFPHVLMRLSTLKTPKTRPPICPPGIHTGMRCLDESQVRPTWLDYWGWRWYIFF